MDNVIEALIYFDHDACSTTDIASLRRLLRSSSIRTEEYGETNPDEIGFNFECLAVLIPLAPQITQTLELLRVALQTWLENRHVKIIIKDRKTGRSVEVNSDTGISTKQLEMCFQYTSRDS